MKKLSVKLNQDYKSFKTGYSFELEGDLVILSGVNGSGKSQLLDIIRQQWPNESKNPSVPFPLPINNSKGPIEATIEINSQRVLSKDIIFRSFRENINIAEIKTRGVQKVINDRKELWNAYDKYKLDSTRKELEQYQGISKKGKGMLIDKYGIEKFNSLTEKEINQLDLSDFSWEGDDSDIFSNYIGDLFLIHAKKVFDGHFKNGKNFDLPSVGEPPWKKLNNIFSEFGFEYRFKNGIDDYRIDDIDRNKLNEDPKLYQLKEDGSIDDSDSRNLADLSDGEKALIMFIFASITNSNNANKKALLLDEFDAVFNPSITEVFFEIINKYFVEKGILVIIATHSLATISLAPEGTSFYEVFSKNKSKERILPVQREEYSDFGRVTSQYYEKTKNQIKRVEELQEKEKELERLKNNISKISKETVFVEGPTDVLYIKKAYELYGKKLKLDDFELQIIGRETSGGTKNSNNVALKKAGEVYRDNPGVLKNKILLLNDPGEKIAEGIYDGKVYIRGIPPGEGRIKNGIENLFEEDLIIRALKAKTNCFDYHITGGITHNFKIPGDNKKELCDWICENATKEDFKNFEKIFEIIEEIKTD